MIGYEIVADLSIPLRFDAPQPNAYGVERATATACEYGDLVGDTRRGGSCNFERVTLIPHCNGTHTECVGHITNERISIRDCLQDVLIAAVLVSVEPEKYDTDDSVITRASLQAAIADKAAPLADAASGPPASVRAPAALIVRTLPNDNGKLSRVYDEKNIPPYFAEDAMRLIVERGFKHLLVDLPSIDRIYDEGRLANHRMFWNVEADSREVNADTRINSTITELVYVPNTVADGEYLLNLQIAPFESDAAPSRPILLNRML